MKFLLTVMLGLCGVLPAGTQTVDTPILKSGDVPGLSVTRTGHYDGNALFGYMDGGAELYREYGFIDLTVQEMELGGQQFLLELFRMRDSLASFGIFSVFRGQCVPGDSITQYWCFSPGQVVCAEGRYFFRVQRLTGGPDGKSLAVLLGKKILSLLPDSSLMAVPWVTGKSSPRGWQRDAVVVCGPLGLQNGFPDWLDPLEGGEYRSITILPWIIEDKPATLGWIQCNSGEQAAQLGRQMATHKLPHWRFVRQWNDKSFLVIESELPKDCLEQFAATLLGN
jgi:hypothetical protein